MRIPLWLDLRDIPVNKRLPFWKTAKKVEAEAVLLGKDDPHLDKEGAIKVDGRNALKIGTKTIGRYVVLRNAKDQDRAAKVDGIVIVDAKNWAIIPLENLIAARKDKPGTLFAHATTVEDALVFRDTLEVGVHGIVFAPESVEAVEELHEALLGKGISSHKPKPAATGDFLVPATITKISDAGAGDRVCIDTTSIFRPGEGLLIGSTARGFALVHAETVQSEFVAKRPFRVNAGAVHSYLYSPEGKTRYLSELTAGTQVLAIHPDGVHRVLTVGRAKIERRPHFLIAWNADGHEGNAVLQNAETIRLVRPSGEHVSVTELKEGDQILVHLEESARHFGMPVDEFLEEK